MHRLVARALYLVRDAHPVVAAPMVCGPAPCAQAGREEIVRAVEALEQLAFALAPPAHAHLVDREVLELVPCGRERLRERGVHKRLHRDKVCGCRCSEDEREEDGTEEETDGEQHFALVVAEHTRFEIRVRFDTGDEGL